MLLVCEKYKIAEKKTQNLNAKLKLGYCCSNIVLSVL